MISRLCGTRQKNVRPPFGRRPVFYVWIHDRGNGNVSPRVGDGSQGNGIGSHINGIVNFQVW